MLEHTPFGRHLNLTVRGASHAPALTFALSGLPVGLRVDETELAAFMARRAPGRDTLSTARHETDAVTFTSGLANGHTTHEPLAGRIANEDMRPHDYGSERTIPRPGHADFGQWIEHGRIPTGGGANSGRLTAAYCAAGGVCLQALRARGVSIRAEIAEIGGCTRDFDATIASARAEGDSVGGIVTCTVDGLPAGLGGALFAGLESELAAAFFAIPGVRGVSFGNGFDAARLKGSENDDPFTVDHGFVRTATNRHGGVLGGRTTGMPLVVRIAFKPTPTIFKPLPSVDLATMTAATCAMKGRHDPCIVRRALPVVEAMTAFSLLDAWLAQEAATPRICLTLTGKTLAENDAQYAVQRYFTDMLELRVDLLSSSERNDVSAWAHAQRLPIILTFRRACDGGAFSGSEEERVDFFRRTLKPQCGFAYVDFEDDFRHDELSDLAHAAGVRIIRSQHLFTASASDIPARCRALCNTSDEIAKLAFMPQSLADVTRLFHETANFTDVPHVVCAMGAKGLSSRILTAHTHSLWTYTSVSGLGDIGHITPYELVRTYRFRSLTHDTALYGVCGFPLKHTRSPEINNAAFAAYDHDGVMIPFPADTAEEAFAFMKTLGMRGMAVTIPHKRAIMALLDKCDDDAQAVGAVNTVVREGGKFVGYNTDVAGFTEALTDFLGTTVVRRAALLGDGGAAQAVKVALANLNMPFDVFHRTTPKGTYDLIVNATPVDPIPDYAFTGQECVFDLGYVPDVTPLMARAHAAGCRVSNGFSMLVVQAREQRRLYEAARTLEAES